MTAQARPVWATARVAEVVALTDRIRRVVLHRPGAGRAAPGSHLDVRVDTPSGTAVRSYSVVDADPRSGLMAVSVLRAEPGRGGSAHMHRLAVGDEIACTQPLPDFELRPGASRYVLLAGGIGITALLEMGRVLRRLGVDYRFVYAGRSRAAMAYLDRLVELHGDRLELHVDDEGSGLDVPGLVKGLACAPGAELYMCGPIRLMDAVRRAWVAAGLRTGALRFETFGNSGWFAPESFRVQVPELGVDTVVPPGATLLETLVEAGVDVMYDCRKGECGLCELRIRSRQGVVDHRDVFLSDRQKASGESLCACVSRLVAGPGGSAGTGRLTLAL